MAPIRKHGGHRHILSLAAIAAATPIFEGMNFDAFAVGTLDAAQEFLLEANITTNGVLTGQATNFSSIALQQYSQAGVLKNDIRVAFNAAGVVTVAFAPLNYNVAVGAVV